MTQSCAPRRKKVSNFRRGPRHEATRSRRDATLGSRTGARGATTPVNRVAWSTVIARRKESWTVFQRPTLCGIERLRGQIRRPTSRSAGSTSPPGSRNRTADANSSVHAEDGPTCKWGRAWVGDATVHRRLTPSAQSDSHDLSIESDDSGLDVGAVAIRRERAEKAGPIRQMPTPKPGPIK